MFDLLHQKLVHHAPVLLKLPVQCMPKSLQHKLLLQSLGWMFHEALDDGDFEFLEGKWLKISIQDLDLHWWLSYQNEQLIVGDRTENVDVHFSANLNELVLVAGRKEDPDTLFFQRRLIIEGDTELGLEVKNLLDSIDFNTFPKPLYLALNQLAEFVQKGVYLDKSSSTQAQINHAYTN